MPGKEGDSMDLTGWSGKISLSEYHLRKGLKNLRERNMWGNVYWTKACSCVLLQWNERR